VTVCAPSAIAGVAVMVAVPATHAAVPAVTPSILSVTVFPLTQAVVKSGVLSEVMLSVFDVPESVAAVMSGAVVGAVAPLVLTVTESDGDAADVLPAGSVSVYVIAWTPSATAGVAVIVARPATQVPVPAETPSILSVTVLPVMHGIVNTGVVTEVMLSVFDAPESLAAVRSGATVGVRGAVVSIVIDSAGEAADVLPAVSVSVNVTACTPSAIAGVAVIVTLPLTHTPVPAATPSTRSVTVFPVIHTRAKSGVVSEVTLSVDEAPVSVAAVMSGPLVGVAGTVASIVTLSEGETADTLPAASVSV
jgi:hypothetical protein